MIFFPFGARHTVFSRTFRQTELRKNSINCLIQKGSLQAMSYDRFLAEEMAIYEAKVPRIFESRVAREALRDLSD